MRPITSMLYLCVCVLLTTSCQYTQSPAEQEKGTQEQQKKFPRLTVLRKELQKTPLIERWHHRLEDKKVRRLYICDNLLLVETQANQLLAIERRDGIPQWIHTVGDPIDFPPTCYKDRVYILSMGKMHVLVKSTGASILEKQLEFVPSSPACATDKYVIMGGWDNFVYAVNPKDGLRDWRYRIDGVVTGAPQNMDGSLYFSSTDEYIYKINAQSGATIEGWADGGKFKTFAPNKAGMAIVKKPPVMYVPSRDYNLYSINRITGVLNWKFESGGEINNRPYLIGTSVYVISDRLLDEDAVLYSLDSQSGNQKWHLEHASDLLFQGKYHLWVRRRDGRISSVNPEDGAVEGSYTVDSFRAFVTNVSDYLGFVGYMATADGYVFAVEEK